MSRPCDVCGNVYEETFEVRLKDVEQSFWFDCIECAAHKIAPLCLNCGTRILGHGVQVDQKIYCCGHCARAQGEQRIVDHTSASIAF